MESACFAQMCQHFVLDCSYCNMWTRILTTRKRKNNFDTYLSLELAMFSLQHVDLNANYFVSTCITIIETFTAPHHWNAIPNLPNLHKNGRTNKLRRATCTTRNGQTNSPRAFLGKAGDGKEWTKWREPYQGRWGAGILRSRTAIIIKPVQEMALSDISRQWCGKERQS